MILDLCLLSGVPEVYLQENKFKHDLRAIIGGDPAWKLLDNWWLMLHMENHVLVKSEMEKWNLKLDEVPLTLEGVQLNPGTIELGKTIQGFWFKE